MRMPLDRMKIRRYQMGQYNPCSNLYGEVRIGKVHQGWDLEAVPNTPVYAIAKGWLTFYLREMLGLHGILEFADARYPFPLYAVYAHLMEGKSKKLGQRTRVSEGELIAYTGFSGNARNLPLNEMHLHFEIRRTPKYEPGLGTRFDPRDVLGYHIPPIPRK